MGIFGTTVELLDAKKPAEDIVEQPQGPTWKDQENELKTAGFDDNEIAAELSRQTIEMQQAGFTDDEIRKDMGFYKFDPKPLQDLFAKNLTPPKPAEEGKPAAPDEAGMATLAARMRKGSGNLASDTMPGGVHWPEFFVDKETGEMKPATRPSDGFIEAFKAAFQFSPTAMLMEDPELHLKDNPNFGERLAAGAGSFVGDFPWMLIGGAAGAEGGPLAAVSAFALPAAMRQVLMDKYQKGEVRDFKDFWQRTSDVFIQSLKSGGVGLATFGAGKYVGSALQAASPALRTAGQLGAEATTMTAVGAAMEGHVPTAQEFVDGAVLVVALHGMGKILPKVDYQKPLKTKLEKIYAETGMTPAQVLEHAAQEPAVLEQLLSRSKEIPDAYKVMRDPTLPEVKPEKAPENPMGATNEGEQVPIYRSKEQGSLFLAEEAGNVGLPERKATPEPTSAEKTIDDTMGKGPKKELNLSFDELWRIAVDDLHPLAVVTKLMAGEKIPEASKNPYIMARLARGNFGRADFMIEHGTFDFDSLKTNGKGFKEIFDPIKGDLQGFRRYAISKRALEKAGQGKQPFGEKGEAKLAAAKEIVANGGEKYEQIFRDAVEYQNRVVDYLVKSGIVAPESANLFKAANKDYVPFFRAMDQAFSDGVGGKGLNVRKTVKQFIGSDRAIIDPIESMIKNTYTHVIMAERNRALRSLVEMAENSPGGSEFFEKVKARQRAIEVSPEELARFSSEFGIDAEHAAFAMTIFRPEKVPLADHEFVVFRNGKREVWATTPEIAKAIKGMDAESVSLGMKVLSIPAKALRGGTVLTPEFAGRNIFNDQIDAFIKSKNGYLPFWDAIVGMKEILGGGDAYQNWMKGGGGNSAMVSIDRDYIQQHVFKLDHETGFITNMKNVVRSPIEFMRMASELGENATRVGEFKRAAKGKSDPSSIYGASFDSRNVTVDFARMGAKMKGANSLAAFLNAHVQGLSRTGESFMGDVEAVKGIVKNLQAGKPITAEAKALLTGFNAKAITGITVPSVLLWYNNYQDPRWKEIPRWQKDLAWIIMTDKWVDKEDQSVGVEDAAYERLGPNGKYQKNVGTIYRIPKTHEIGVLYGSIPERILEHFVADNPKAFNDLGETLKQALVPGMAPTFAVPLAEQTFNRSFFTDRDLIPGHLEKNSPELQVREYSTETGKMIGRFVGRLPMMGFFSAKSEFPYQLKNQPGSIAAPIVFENYIRGWTGGMGTYALKLMDEALIRSKVIPDPIKPASTLSDLPFIKAFVVRYPSSGAQSIQDFHDNYGKFETYLMDRKERQKRNDHEGLQQELEDRDKQHLLVNIDGVRETLSIQNAFIQKVSQDPSMDKHEKRRMIDDTYMLMIQTAKIGNTMVDEAKKAMKESNQ